MKYNSFKVTNLIFLILALSLCLVLFSCNNDEITESDISSQSPTEESSRPETILTVDQATQLVQQDKLVTEIFVCNALCDDSMNDSVCYILDEDKEYAQFKDIQKLLNSTYSQKSMEKEFFLAYPAGLPSSLSNAEGKTSVFRHPGSGYSDFIDESTITVSDTASESKKLIKGKTKSGREVILSAVCENDSWFLEKGIFNSYPEELSPPPVFNRTDVGSFSKLSGDILVIEFFVTDEATEITSAEEDAFHQKVLSAVELLSETAEKFGIEANFSYDEGYFYHEAVLGNRVLDFDLMFAESGFGTLKNYAETAFDVSKYDGYLFVVCLEKDIQTSAGVYDNTEDTEFYYGERVIITPNSTEYSIYSAMLELLGAYGYNSGIADPYIESLYSVYFPDDSLSVDNNEREKISPVTAYLCGFRDELERIYRVFIPNNQE